MGYRPGHMARGKHDLLLLNRKPIDERIQGHVGY